LPFLRGIARFYARDTRLQVADDTIEASRGTDRAGRPFVWANVAVEPGASRTVRVVSK
jgi:hypothetical protein